MDWSLLPDTPQVWGNPEDDLEVFIEAVKLTLQRWVDLHTKREFWAEEFSQHGDQLTTLYKDGIENTYFSFDLTRSVLKQVALEWIEDAVVVRCSGCGTFEDSHFFDCDCEEGVHEEELGLEDLDDLVWWLEETEYGVYGEPEEVHIWNALVSDGFDSYYEQMLPVFESALEMITHAIKDIDNALESGDPAEVLAAVMAGTQVYHVHGNVMEDYGNDVGLDPAFVDEVRRLGYDEVFGEQVAEFLGILEVA